MYLLDTHFHIQATQPSSSSFPVVTGRCLDKIYYTLENVNQNYKTAVQLENVNQNYKSPVQLENVNQNYKTVVQL